MLERTGGHLEVSRRVIQALPKAELHVHLEGTADAEGLRELLGGRGAPVPPDLDDLYRHGDFAGFLDRFRRLLDLLREPSDYGRIAGRYLDRAVAQGVRHVELTVSLGAALRRGLAARPVLESIRAAADERRGRIGATVLVDCVRQFGPDAALRVVEEAGRNLDLGLIAGFGMGGDETSVDAIEFRGVYRRARELGLRTTVHAGEVGGPESVGRALDVLEPDRIAHGIAAAGSPALLERLRRRGITLDVCPTSNLRTGAVARLDEHPLPRLLAAEVRVTLGSDDPALFGTDLLGEYEMAARLGVGAGALAAMARHSLAARFPPALA